MITIKDVATEAGVSVSTVSHALSGKRTISSATKDKVFEAIARLGYEPNPAARALRTTSSGVIGFYAYDITEVFTARIIQGAEKVAREKGFYLLFTSGVEFGGDVANAVDFMRKRRVDGIIIAYGVRQSIEPASLSKVELPMVTVNSFLEEKVPSVQPDDFSGGREAALHLLGRGSRDCAVIGGPPSRVASNDRIAGFVGALRAAGREFDARTRVIHGDFGFESGARCLETLLAANPRLDALFCANDYMAAGAINKALALGRSIPGDLRVVGYDDREFASFWPIPITTFALPLERMGQVSASLLIDRLHGRASEADGMFLASELIQRASS